MLTNEEFMKIPAGGVFYRGLALNVPEDLYITDTNEGRVLRWIAKKGMDDDWCIYCGWRGHYDEWILQHGEKVQGEKHIKRCLPCDDTVFSKYRH